MRSEMSRIIGPVRDRRLVGHLIGRNEIAFPDFILRQACFARRRIDQAFENISRFGPSGAAIGVGRRGVAENAADAHMNRWRLVNACQHRCAEIVDVGAIDMEIGAKPAHPVEAHGEEATLIVESEFGDDDAVPPMRVGHEMIGAIGDPFDRPLQDFRRFGRQGVFIVDETLRAEAAADIRRDDAQRLGLAFEDRRQHALHVVDALAGDGDRPPARRLVMLRDAAARLHIVGDDAVVLDLALHDARRGRENRIHLRLVADRRVEDDIAGRVSPHERRAVFQRRADVRDRGFRRPVDDDRFRRVPRLSRRVRDDERHRLPDISRGSARENRPGRLRPLAAVAIVDGREARHVAEMSHIVAGQDEPHARHGASGAKIGDREIRMGVRAPQGDRVEARLGREIVGVAAAPGDETLILDPANRLADAEFHGRKRIHGMAVRDEESATILGEERVIRKPSHSRPAD